MPWASGEQDERGDPLPQQPAHLFDSPSYRVERPTEEQIGNFLEMIRLSKARWPRNAGSFATS